MTRSSRTTALTLGLAIVALTVVPAARADNVSWKVDSFYGSFSQEVPIIVPKFRGLEPQIRLTYDSAGGNGLVGVGWSLNGFSTIERASPGRGAPKYNSSDIYLIDGREMVASTGLGGTHATKIQSYQRIKFDSAANTWYVWSKDGTKATYTSRLTTSLGTYRWGISSMVDPRGNTVTYTFTCDSYPECYPSTVTYNQTTVKLYWETRPDPYTYALGGAKLAKVVSRLRSIDVKVGTARARAYKLTYGTSGSTGRSLLTAVQLFGKTCAVSTAGLVSGGTSIPANTFHYASADESYPEAMAPEENWGTQSQTTLAAPVNWGAYDALNNWAAVWVADMNGDGKKDLLYLDDAYTTNGYRVLLANSTGTAFLAPRNWGAYDPVAGWAQTFVRDMNGDGKPDLLYLASGSTQWRVKLNTGSGFQTQTTWGTYDSINSWSAFWVEDVTGDGLPDLVYLDNAYTTNGYRVMKNTGSAFAAATNWATYETVNGWAMTTIADMNGDGKKDLVYLSYGGSNGWRVRLSTGTSFGAVTTWGAYDALNNWSAFWFADMNGDGKTDLLYLDDAYTTNGYRVMLSTGTKFQSPINWGPYDSVNSWSQVFVRDMNNDGKADLLYLDNAYTTQGYRVMFSTGTGFTAPQNYGVYEPVNSFGSNQFHVADFTGDGLPDILYLDDAYTTNGWRVMRNTGLTPDTYEDWWTYTPVKWAAYDPINSWSQYWVADVTGDGLPDVIYLDDAYTTNGYRVMKNTGSGLAAPVNWGAYDAVNDWSRVYVRDMNGDGKADLLYLDDAYTTNGWRVMLSTGTSFQAPKNWGAYDTLNNWGSFAVADANGDGLPDLIYLDDAYTTNGWRVMLNTGTKFLAPQNWATYDSVNSWTQFWVKDMNGDGKADLLYLDNAYTTNGYRVMLSTGSSFAAPVNWGAYDAVHSWSAFWVEDANGDGKPDLIYLDDAYTTNGYRVALNTGSSFLAPQNWAAYDGVNAWSQFFVRDMNGDGMADLVYLDDSYGTNGWRVMLSTGTSFTTPINYRNYDTWNNQSSFVVEDMNGDGVPDFFYLDDAYTTNGWRAQRSFAKLDLLDGVTNSMGGSAAITYAPSTKWTSQNGAPLVQTVSALTVDDGRGNSFTSTYSYADSKWDPVERRSLGFRYAKQTFPCNAGESACPYTETWFVQDYGSLAKPERIDRRSGAGKLYSSIVQVYTTNGSTVPYTSLNTGTWSYAYDGSGQACPTSWPQYTICAYGARNYVSRTFDAYGNQLTEVAYGDYDVSGDEKTTQTIYVPNTTSYIVGLPAVTRLFNGAGTGGTLLEEALTTYDSNTTWNAGPTKGLPTKTERMASTTPSYQSLTQQYDSYGNVTAEYGPLGQKSAYLYDSTYHLFRTEVRDPLYHGLGATPADPRHKKTLLADVLCGGETQEVAKSGLVTTRQYDALCRLTRLDDSSGYFEIHSYNGAGTPGSQYIEVQTPAANGSGNLWKRLYVDGLGRNYKTVMKGPSTSQDIIEETTYSKRNQVAGRTYPYYSGESPKWVNVGYDALDRVTRTTYPDGGFESRSYGVGVVTTTDEGGISRSEWKDGLGRVTKRRQWRGGVALDTTYAYNVRGQATQITDHKGNVYKVTYNTAGQRATYVDPDRGTTTYQYDAAGHNTAVINALGQRTEYAYDLLGRKTSQVEKRANGTVERSLSWTYDQERSGYYNIGGLTTMSDGVGTATFDYDVKGRLVKAVRTLDGASYTFYHGFDTGGRLLWSTLPDGDTIGTSSSPRTYDNAGRPLSIPGYVTTASYNARGQMLSLTRANGTVTSYGYDANRTWLTDIYATSGSGTIQNLHYSRDAIGRTVQVTSPFSYEGWNYAYDELGFLTSATNHSSSGNNQAFGYDTTGNLTSVTRPGGSIWSYAYNSAHGPTAVRPHAVVSTGASTYTYDAAGNMLTGAGRTITWGVNGMPLTINGDAYAYDGNNVRVKKMVGALTTYYVSGEYEVTGGTTTKYIDFMGEPVAKRVGTVKYFLHADGLGSIQSVTDANGIEVARMKYRPYGERLSTSGSNVENLSFTGQRQDESGLFYLNARYYDPQLGRFISADPTIPSVETVGLNRYAYAGNDPINNLDTNGLSFWKKIKKFFKKIWKAVVKVVKALVNIVKAALHGDWKAILTIVILVATIYFGGIALAWAVQAAGASAATVASSGALVAAYQAGAAAMLAATAMSAAVGFASSFAIGYVQTGSFSAALKAGVNGAIGAVINIGLNFTLCKLGVVKMNEMGTDPADGQYKIGFSDKLSMGMSDKFQSTKGYYNSAVGQMMAEHIHDPFAEWLKQTIIGSGEIAKASLLKRDIYCVLNVSTAFLFQATAEAVATSVIEQAFGKMHETPSAAINQLNGATSFFSIPKDLPPGVTREQVARSAIRVRF